MRKRSLPTDDKLTSVERRMDAVENGNSPVMPGLESMTKKQMAKALQSIWTVLDETGVQRRNETDPKNVLTIYGRVHAAIRNGPIVPASTRMDAGELTAYLERIARPQAA